MNEMGHDSKLVVYEEVGERMEVAKPDLLVDYFPFSDATRHLIISANGYMIRYDPDRSLQSPLGWTAVSPSGRLGDYATADEALAAVLDDQARRLQGYLLPGERVTVGPGVNLIYITDKKQ